MKAGATTDDATLSTSTTSFNSWKSPHPTMIDIDKVVYGSRYDRQNLKEGECVRPRLGCGLIFSPSSETELAPDCVVDMWPDATTMSVDPEEVEALRVYMMEYIKRIKFNMYGKECTMRRKQLLQTTHHDADKVAYTFSRQTLRANPQLPLFVAVEKCIAFANICYPTYDFNVALCNLYEDGTDYISPHSDDEDGHVNGAPILTFSFGATREMRFRERGRAHAPKNSLYSSTYSLTPGSCLVMRGSAFQRTFTHEIKAQKNLKSWRLSITVRAFNVECDCCTSKRDK